MTTDNNDRRLVLPSEEVATVEEFIGGKGTYEENGKIFVSTAGELVLDREEMKAEVKPFKPLAKIQKGDEVFAVIRDMRSAMITARAIAIVGLERALTGEDLLSLHVSKVSSEYVKDVTRHFRIGDIIRAKVISHKPSLQIATDGQRYGVLKSYCMKCRQPLTMGKAKLECKDCKRFETRKTASDYGFVQFK